MKTISLKDVIVTCGGVQIVGFADDRIEVAPSLEPVERQPETGREEATARLAAVVEAMERLLPGCTHTRDGVTYYNPRNAPKGHVFSVALCSCAYMDGRHTVEVGESSWVPAWGPMSDGGATLPDGETPEATAKRLLCV